MLNKDDHILSVTELLLRDNILEKLEKQLVYKTLNNKAFEIYMPIASKRKSVGKVNGNHDGELELMCHPTAIKSLLSEFVSNKCSSVDYERPSELNSEGILFCTAPLTKQIEKVNTAQNKAPYFKVTTNEEAKEEAK